MITSCRIKNFKCFEDFEMSGLKRINLITGKNNVGKTALLEAMYMLIDRTNPHMIIRQNFSRGLDSFENNIESSTAPIFFDYDTKREIHIEIDKDGMSDLAIFKVEDIDEAIIKKPSKPNKQDYNYSQGTQPVDYEGKQLTITVKHDTEIVHQSHLYVSAEGWVNRIIKQSPKDSWYLFKYGPFPTMELSRRFSELVKKDQEPMIVEIMKQFEPRLKGLKIATEGQQPVIHCKLDGLTQTIPINFAGDGFCKLLGLVLYVIASDESGGAVFLVDEIENGLHYSIFPKFWNTLSRLMAEHKCQLFATTHSYEMVQAALDGISEHKDDFNFMRLDSEENGQIVARQSDYEMIEIAVETNLEVR